MKLFSKRKDRGYLVIAVTIGVLVIGAGLWQDGKNKQEIAAEESRTEELYTVSKIDLLEDAGESAKEMVLSEKDGNVIISEGGDYVISGELKGRIEIDAPDEIVHLILVDVEINSHDGPAIYGKDAGKLIVTIPEDTTTILQDSAYYENNKDSKACLFSSCDLTINGSGNLQVYGFYKDGIRTKDVLKLLGPSILVKAKNIGLRGNEGVAVKTQYLEIQSEKIGIYTKKSKKGYVDLGGGSISIIGGEYAIDSAQDVYIHDCLVALTGVIQDIKCKGNQTIEEGCMVN